MAGSLQDQLKKSGLVSKKKSQQLDAEKRKKIKAKNKGQKSNNEIAEKVKQAKLQKTQDDKKQNQQQQQQLKQNEEKARIKQIIDQAKIKDYDGDTAFNFQFNNKIKTLHINKENYDALVQAVLGSVRSITSSFCCQTQRRIKSIRLTLRMSYCIKTNRIQHQNQQEMIPMPIMKSPMT